VLFDIAHRDPDGVGDLRLGPGLFQPLLIGLQIGEMKKVLRTDVLEQDLILIVVEQEIEVFCAADPMMVRALGANEDVFPQFRNGTDIVAVGALRPKPLRRFLLLCRAGENTFFDASEPTALAFLTLSFIAGQIRFKIVVMFHGLIFVFCHSNGLLFGAATARLHPANFGGKDTKDRPFMVILSY
jgi:hypothetical protein